MARAKEAKVSMIRFTHSICTAFRGESCRERREKRVTPPKPAPFLGPFAPRAWPCSPYLRDAGARESHDDGHHVDGQLELQELGDAVVDVAAPHHRLDDAGEVVVRQDDVRSLLGHVSACDALEGRGGSGRDEA